MFPLLVSTVSGHGSMVMPASWITSDGQDPYENCNNGACMWFTNYTFLPQADGSSYAPKNTRTMPGDSPMRTYGRSDPTYAAYGRYPWAAPGLAEVYSPCGIYGGNPFGCPAGDENSRGMACFGGGYGYGEDALKEYGKSLTGMEKTKVAVGGELEAGFALQANHGGGYAYRLCKLPEDGDRSKLTEECFQAGHLEFANNDHSWVQFGKDKKNRIKFKATRSTNGTYPAGAVWTKNPIAPCNNYDGGVFSEVDDNCAVAEAETGYKTQFEPEIPGLLQGFGEHATPGVDPAAGFSATFGFMIVDKLQIPTGLEAGDYVLSWRWDCEQTSQIWNTCADIEITTSKNLQERLVEEIH